jgi:hypothetical protein
MENDYPTYGIGYLLSLGFASTQILFSTIPRYLYNTKIKKRPTRASSRDDLAFKILNNSF